MKLQGASGYTYEFRFFETIEPDKNNYGQIQKYTFTDREVGGKRNKYGDGSFCSFSLQDKRNGSCVYLWLREDGDVTQFNDRLYIGQTDDLQRRFYEYGHISASSCQVNGSSTNCKMNKVLLRYGKIDLYVYPTDTPDIDESDLLANNKTLFNEQEN